MCFTEEVGEGETIENQKNKLQSLQIILKLKSKGNGDGNRMVRTVNRSLPCSFSCRRFSSANRLRPPHVFRSGLSFFSLLDRIVSFRTGNGPNVNVTVHSISYRKVERQSGRTFRSVMIHGRFSLFPCGINKSELWLSPEM